MNVITSNPIMQMSSFTGNKNDVARVKAFQYFVRANEKPTEVVVNGIWDKATEDAAKTWGEKFDKLTFKDQNFVSKVNDIINAPTSKNAPNPMDPASIAAAALSAGQKTTETTLTEEEKTEEEKKARRMKIIATAGGAVVGFAIAKFVMKTNKPMMLIGLTLVGAGAGFMVSKMMKKK